MAIPRANVARLVIVTMLLLSSHSAIALTAYLRPAVLVGDDREPAAELLDLTPNAATLVGADTIRERLSIAIAGPLVMVGNWTAIASHPFHHDALRQLAKRRTSALGDHWRIELHLLESLPSAVAAIRSYNRDGGARILEVEDDRILFSYREAGHTRHDSVEVSIDRYSVVAIARVNIRSGDLVDAELFHYEERLLPGPANDFFGVDEELPRLEAVRALHAGDVLKRDHLRAVRAITAGEEVLLRFAHGAVEVTLPGHATQSADLDAQVRVRTSALGGYRHTDAFAGIADRRRRSTN